MRALIRIVCGLGLGFFSCTQQIELFPTQSPPGSSCPDAAPANQGCGCVPAVDASGTVIPCVCKLACETDSDCPVLSTAGLNRCDPATGLCRGQSIHCTTRSDCPSASNPANGASVHWLCISAK